MPVKIQGSPKISCPFLAPFYMVEVVAGGVDSCNNLHTNQMNDKILFLILLGL